jgi:hypothetical protein
MPARTRDAIAVGVLLAAGVAAVLAWHPLGRWPALVIALAGVLIAAGVYRARRPAFPLFGTADPLEPSEPEPDDGVSTPRRASAPHAPS